MSKILTNYEKLYVENEKEGSRIISLTSSLPITLNLTNYSQNLKGNVKVVISGNNTTTPSVKIEFSDLYKYGETYSASLIAWNGQDGITIPIIINNSDTLIYTNIPNNVINDISNGAYIKYTSIPEVRSMKILYPATTKDYSSKLDVGNGYSSVWLTKSDLTDADYIQASNTLSKLSIKVGVENSSDYGNSILERITPTPISVSYAGGEVVIKFKSSSSGIAIVDMDNFEVKHNGLTHVSWETNNDVVTWTLAVNKNEGDKDKTYTASVREKTYNKGLGWTINQSYAVYDFRRITPSPININYTAQIVKIQFHSKFGNENVGYSFTTGGLKVVESVNIGGGEISLEVPENTTNSNKEYKIYMSQYGSKKELDWIVKQAPKPIDNYELERITLSPINIDYRLQIISIEFRSLKNGAPFVNDSFTYDVTGSDITHVDTIYMNGFFIANFKVNENLTPLGKEFDITITNNVGLHLEYHINQESNIYRAEYEFEAITPSPINIGRKLQKVSIQFKSLKNGDPFGGFTHSTSLSYIDTIDEGDGIYTMNFEVNENTNTSSNSYNITLTQMYSEKTLTWEILQDWVDYTFVFTGRWYRLVSWNSIRLALPVWSGGYSYENKQFEPIYMYNGVKVDDIIGGFSTIHSINEKCELVEESVGGWSGYRFYDFEDPGYCPDDNRYSLDIIYPFSQVTNATKLFAKNNALYSIPIIDTSNVTNMSEMFNGCTNLTTIPQLDISKVNYMSEMFSNCTKLTTIPQLDTSKVINMSYMFYHCESLTSLPMLDMVSLRYTKGMFMGCNSLTYLGGFKDLNCDLSLSSSPLLTYDSLMNVINNLSNVPPGDTITLTLSGNSYSLLSDEDIAKATSKGWLFSIL